MALVAGATVLGLASAASAATSYDVVATIDTGSALADGLAVDHAHNAVYVVNSNVNQVSVIDTTTNAVKTTIPVGAAPFRVAVDAGLNRAYVTNSGSSSVSVIDTSTNTVVSTITDPRFNLPRGVAVDPTTHLVYVAIYYDNQMLAVIDPTKSPATIDYTDILESRPWAVDVDPTTHRAYPTTLFGGTLSAVSGTTILSTIYGFGGPTQVTVDPLTKRAYVANSWGMGVVDISGDTPVVTGSLTAGSQPSDLAIDQDARTFYVTNRNDNTVSVIDAATSTIVATVPVGPQPAAVEVDPVTHLAYVVNSDNTITVISSVSTQEITFTSLPPAEATVGGAYSVSAIGGGSGQPVTFSVDPTTTNAACSIADGTVSFDHAGTCVIAADQTGDADYTAAPHVTQQIVVGLNPTSAAVILPVSSVVYGQAATAKVAVNGTHDGSVQFTLDGTPVGGPVVLESDGTANSADLAGAGLAVGSHQIGADFTPTDDNRYAGSSATPQTLTVSQAATTSSVSVDGTHVTAMVTPTAPGTGVPTGTVRFYLAGTEIGSAALTDGTATLAYQVPAGSTRNVSTVYAGDAAFTGSSASTARRDPVITASVASAKARRNGWYSTPVTVTFRCEQTSAALTGACPAPVTLSRSAAAQSVTRTIMATDGGAATVVVSGINIDRVRPIVRVTGVRAGATYFASGPVAGCRATDSLSGIATCTVTRTTRGHRVAYVATATDRAGNRSSTRLVARTTSVAISGASMQNGHYVVHLGRTYTVLVAAAKRPSYLYAAPSPRRPAGGGIPFKHVGKNQWALGVTFKQSMSHHTWWNIGTRVGSHTTVTNVRVVR